jgi:hypothetical protein
MHKINKNIAIISNKLPIAENIAIIASKTLIPENINIITNKLQIIEKYLKSSGTANCTCLDKAFISKQFENLNEHEIEAVINNSVKILDESISPVKYRCLSHNQLINGFRYTFPDRKITDYIDYNLFDKLIFKHR